MSVKRRDDEDGFTMIVTVIGMSLIALLALVAVTAVNGDSHMTSRDLSRKQAYEAAKAGIDEYAFRLHTESAYWARCDNVGSPSAVNQMGSTANWRSVPGMPEARYAIELIPASGQSSCDSSSVVAAKASMLEPANGPNGGTFRIRSNGYAGDSHVAIVAMFKPASFLDYVYFTQYETSDPVSYANEELRYGAEKQCERFIRDGRTTTALRNRENKVMNEEGRIYRGKEGEREKYCEVISFVSADNIKGPMHTNDAFVICGEPTLGRGSNDPIEVGQRKGESLWFSTSTASLHAYSSCGGSQKKFLGQQRLEAGIILPPETNAALEEVAGPGYTFREETSICLNGSTFTTGAGSKCTSAPKPFPPTGVIYVASVNCPQGLYSPFNLAYSESTVANCGNVNVSGTYSKPLTIAAQNDVIVRGNLTKTNEEALLGLIANNFIRIYHPVGLKTEQVCEWNPDTGKNECRNVTKCTGNAANVIKNVNIEAAILAIKHSFIVDNFNCGSSLGTLSVKGAIAQKFRGAVGTTGGNGFSKNYEYDERLQLTEPPSFIQPIEADWVIGRETTE
jgi:type II secretory pathway pseudopilin PulG